MKKFMSMLMLVLLTITLSACGRQESALAADFTFETSDITTKGDTKYSRYISGNLTATNNTKYYITNYPIVAYNVDESGNAHGERYVVTHITMAPNATVTYPIEMGVDLDVETMPANIKVLPIDWQICQEIINKENGRIQENYNQQASGDPLRLLEIDEAHFQQSLNDAVSKQPKNLVYYGVNAQPVECKYVPSKNNGAYNTFEFNLTNNEDYDFRMSGINGILTLKKGDEVVRQIWCSDISSRNSVYLKPGEEVTYSFKVHKNEELGDFEKYDVEITLLPNISGLSR